LDLNVICFGIVILLLLVAAPVLQNAYVSIKNVFKGNSGFVALLNGLFIILISVLIYAILAGEKTIIFQFRTLTSICLPIIFFFQILYLYINFGKQLKERMPVFSILHLPTKIRFISVWFMLAFSVLLAEANWGWRGLAFIRTISDNAKADNGLLQNDVSYSISWYRNALKFTASDPKANFNLATLLIQNKGSLDSASAHLKQASTFFKDFWVSGMNHANLNLLFGNKDAATEILKEAILENNSPWLFNNISYIFYKKNMPDSAIYFLKSSLNSSYRIPETFGNLALIYHRYGKPIEAGKFITLGLENESRNENLAINAIAISLTQDTMLYSEEPDPEKIITESLLNKYSLHTLKK
jgi:tetratricopeptide (TPR) repeat protein